ncbi:MAG: response regulator [Lachnospiraceae bacterium]|nr:response regulator [Lachnospiraceae bacterium]
MYSIIIVDDEDFIRLGINDYIQNTHSDFVVKGTFSNGVDALKYLEDNPVNIVITDIRMPQMDGLTLISHIAEKHPATISIIISSYSEFEYARRALQYGVTSYLIKPLDFLELSTNLQKATEKLNALSIDANEHEENIQLFFIDLLSGYPQTCDEIQNRFSKLMLTHPFYEYKGCILSITLDKNDKLRYCNYGWEGLSTTLLNSIRLALPEYECHYLFRSNMCCFFVVLSSNEEPNFSLELLSSILLQQLLFSCHFKIHATFKTIDQLVTNRLDTSISAAIPSTIAVDTLEDSDILVNRAISYIQAHYTEDISREDVADAVFLSAAHFSRIFKQKTGTSFINYLTSLRMQKTAELLSTNIKINEIANKVGYQSRNRLAINFRQYTGYTPTEYRKQILKMEDSNEECD